MGSFKSYLLGFILSIALTVAAFIMVINHWLSGSVLLVVIMALAFIQLWVQLIFFLHLDREKGPKWNLAIFLSTVGIVIIIVGASLWIMKHLNYNMTPDQINNYLKDQGAF